MRQPKKWRDTVDPFTLNYQKFVLDEVLGYPHAANDVFYARGSVDDEEMYVFIKVERHKDADVVNEAIILEKLRQHEDNDINFLPEVIEYSMCEPRFIITKEVVGERLSVILGRNEQLESLNYLKKYAETLAFFHNQKIDALAVKHRKFFDVPKHEYFEKYNLLDFEKYINSNIPIYVTQSFVHGDFHYANILWQGSDLSAVLDYELSGMGCSEFDIAWSIFLRPGQKFLKTWGEINMFLDSYSNCRGFSMQAFKYFFVLIASRFYELGDEEYKQDVRNLVGFIIDD